MAARPPGGGGGSDAESIEFGIAALDARLDEADVSFPATGEEILDALEETTVSYDASGRTIDLADAFDRIPDDSFESKTELMNTLYPIFEEARSRGGSGIVARIREALPF